MNNSIKPFKINDFSTKEEILDHCTIIDEKDHKILAAYKKQPEWYFVFVKYPKNDSLWENVANYLKNFHDRKTIGNKTYDEL